MGQKNGFVFALALLGIIGWLFAMYAYYIKAERVDKLSANHSANYIRTVVWYHSRGKLEELKSILSSGRLAEPELVQTKVKNMLQHRTSAYIREFNNLDGPLPKLGDLYEKLFDFEGFLQEVYALCFNQQFSVDKRVRLVADVMEKYQMDANNQILAIMKGENK